MTQLPESSRCLLVATRNPAKARELDGVAAAIGVRTVTLEMIGLVTNADEELLEVGDTFEANALAKARHYRQASGGYPTVADDSGLEVDALGGAPGVRSRRWSGAVGSAQEVDAVNNASLLNLLSSVLERGAAFTCVLAYVDDYGEFACRGEVRGHIARSPRGTRGFGYDPIFAVDALDGRTFGEATVAEKAQVSHRARAITALGDALRGRVASSGEHWSR